MMFPLAPHFDRTHVIGRLSAVEAGDFTRLEKRLIEAVEAAIAFRDSFSGPAPTTYLAVRRFDETLEVAARLAGGDD